MSNRRERTGRLRLHRQTLRSLDSQELTFVAGAEDPAPYRADEPKTNGWSRVGRACDAS